MNALLKTQTVGFIGAGNMTHAIIKGLLSGSEISAHQIWISNRTPGKLKKLNDLYSVQVAASNEELIEKCNIIVLAVKPADLSAVLQSTAQFFTPDKVVISIAAGFTLDALEKNLPIARIVRVMPNTPSLIGEGLIGILTEGTEEIILDIAEDLFSTLGKIIFVKDEDHLEALTVACSSGTGFIFEFMLYWNEWLEQHGFNKIEAAEMTRKTFLGAALLAEQSLDSTIEDLQTRVTSKKGVTLAGLESMRELEIERALRISFEKAAMRNRELARDLK